MLLRHSLLDLVNLFIRHRHGFRRQGILFVGPRPKIKKLAPLRTKRAEFVSGKLRRLTTIRTLNYGHNKSINGQINTTGASSKTIHWAKKLLNVETNGANIVDNSTQVLHQSEQTCVWQRISDRGINDYERL